MFEVFSFTRDLTKLQNSTIFIMRNSELTLYVPFMLLTLCCGFFISEKLSHKTDKVEFQTCILHYTCLCRNTRASTHSRLLFWVVTNNCHFQAHQSLYSAYNPFWVISSFHSSYPFFHSSNDTMLWLIGNILFLYT